MKTYARAFAATALAVLAGACGPQAVQARPLNPLEVRQRAAQGALLQRQEAAAHKKGNYNAAYWTTKERQNASYWNSRTVLSRRPTAQPAEAKLQFETRQRRAGEALLQRQEAAAHKKGNYNATYWATKERQGAGYWNKKGVR